MQAKDETSLCKLSSLVDYKLLVQIEVIADSDTCFPLVGMNPFLRMRLLMPKAFFARKQKQSLFELKLNESKKFMKLIYTEEYGKSKKIK